MKEEHFRKHQLDATQTQLAKNTPLRETSCIVGPAETLDLGVTPSGASPQETLPRQLGSYELIRRLGQGGMGEVFEAQQTTTHERVAVKLLPLSKSGKLLQYFKREFRILANVHHPNLIGMHTLECAGDQWFLTMDLIDGVDFLSYVRPEGQLAEARLRAKLPELTAAIAALHARGIVHRDLKPGNVMVDREGRLIVLDFGLVLELKDAESKEVGEIQGTPAYMSPQQIAGEAISPACDWYAMGTMIYEAVSGEVPYSSETLLQLLQIKQREEAPPLPCTVPADLRELTAHLLRRDPSERAGQHQVFAALGMSGTMAPGARTNELIGRDVQLQQLEESLHEVIKHRKPTFVHIRGRSGEGKSSLVETFFRSIGSASDISIFTGRCYDRESVPFKAIDSVIDGISEHLGKQGRAKARRLLPDDISLLLQLFPVLSQIPTIDEVIQQSQAPHRQLSTVQMRLRAFAALRELLQAIADESRAVVIFIDDLQWGDADSAEAMAELLRAADFPLLVVGTFRSEEADQSRFLQQYESLQGRSDELPAPVPINVGQLTESETRQLIEKTARFDPSRYPSIVDRIRAESDGNPYLTIQMLESLHLDGDTVTYRNLNELIDLKLSKLPSLAEHLLKLLTVLGHDVSIAELAEAAGRDPTTVSALTRMRSENLVRWIGEDSEPSLDIYHDKIRESVLESLPTTEKRSCHRRLADAIEKLAGGVDSQALEEATLSNERLRPRLFDLATQYDAAGDSVKARFYGLLAAEQANRQLVLQVSSEYYRIAARHLSGASKRIQYRVAMGYADVSAKSGELENADEQLTRAEEAVSTKLENAQLQSLKASVALKLRPSKELPEVCAETVRQLGIHVPRSTFGFLWGLAFQWSMLRCIPQRPRPEQSTEEASTIERQLAVRLLNRMMLCYRFQNSLRALWVGLKGYNLSRNLPESTDTATADFVMAAGVYLGHLAWRDPAERLLERARQFCEAAEDPLHEAHLSFQAGWTLGASGYFDDSLACHERARRIFGQLGARRNLAEVEAWTAYTHAFRGDLAEALQSARGAMETAMNHGWHAVGHLALAPWAHAVEGDLPFDELVGQLGPPTEPDDFYVSRSIAECRWHCRHGRFAEAQQAIENAWSFMKQNVAVMQLNSTVPALVAWVLRQRAEVLKQCAPKQSRKLYKRALRIARFATWISRFWPRLGPSAYRELALLEAARGKLKLALRHIRSSCRIAEKQGTTFEYAQSLRVQGEIENQLGDSAGPANVARGECELERIREAVRQVRRELRC